MIFFVLNQKHSDLSITFSLLSEVTEPTAEIVSSNQASGNYEGPFLL